MIGWSTSNGQISYNESLSHTEQAYWIGISSLDSQTCLIGLTG